jgi:hypothetical protein
MPGYERKNLDYAPLGEKHVLRARDSEFLHVLLDAHQCGMYLNHGRDILAFNVAVSCKLARLWEEHLAILTHYASSHGC